MSQAYLMRRTMRWSKTYWHATKRQQAGMVEGGAKTQLWAQAKQASHKGATVWCWVDDLVPTCGQYMPSSFMLHYMHCWSRQEMSLGKWCWCQDTIVAHDSQGQSGLRVVNIFEETLKKISLRSSFIKPGPSSIIKPEREYCWKGRRAGKLSKLKKVGSTFGEHSTVSFWWG